ncbi:MAG: Gfo/Idh/MocA family oxidoreductase, partial [Planctomycetota bacterium]
MPRPLKVGIIGLGHLHPRTYMPHFEAAPSTEVVAVSDPAEDLRQGFAADYGVRAYADWRELLEGEQIRLAYVFLPHDECPAAAVACAEERIH